MSFLSGLKSLFGKIGSGIMTGTEFAQVAEPVLALIPGFGPAIVAGIQAALALESLFPQSGLGTMKLPLASAAVQAAQPGVTAPQANAIVSAIVTGLNNASSAAIAAGPIPAAQVPTGPVLPS